MMPISRLLSGKKIKYCHFTHHKQLHSPPSPFSLRSEQENKVRRADKGGEQSGRDLVGE